MVRCQNSQKAAQQTFCPKTISVKDFEVGSYIVSRNASIKLMNLRQKSTISTIVLLKSKIAPWDQKDKQSLLH
jgi:hypothetical protein